jgi:hypothetical protein
LGLVELEALVPLTELLVQILLFLLSLLTVVVMGHLKALEVELEVQVVEVDGQVLAAVLEILLAFLQAKEIMEAEQVLVVEQEAVAAVELVA